MPQDPEDLLIFKLRGAKKSTTKEEEKKPATQEQQKQPEQQQQPKAQEKPQLQAAAPPEQQASPQVQQQKPQAPQAPAAPQQKAAPEQPKEQPKRSVFSRPAQQSTQAPKNEEEQSYAQQGVVEEVEAPRGLNQAMVKKKGGRSGRGNVEMAKGLTCINHPWRPAYAVCNYCSRPFCYADLIDYNSNYYCLEDIDKVSGHEGVVRSRPKNIFSSLSGLFFFVNAGILTYFSYVQIIFIYDYLLKVGLSFFLSSITYSYIISIINLVLIVCSIIAGVAVTRGSNAGFYFGALVGTFILIIGSYEYLNSYKPELLGICVIALLNIAMLAYSRMSSTETQYSAAVKTTDIDWPKLESF